MNNIKRISVSVLGLFLITLSCGKDNTIPDYLNTGKVISFNNVKYNLAWSSHPSDNYYKQEYLAEKDSLEKFKKLILLEVLTGAQLKDVVASKVAELKKLKESDPIVNYDIFEKDGEVMLDFILSQNITNDMNDMSIIERNIYRYKPFSDINGKNGVVLFGVSERAYGNDIENFLIALKQNRFDMPNAAGAFTIPEISISK